MGKMQIAGIILAAGESSRMGRDKALLPLGAETFIERLLGVLSGLAAPIIVVLGHHSREIERQIEASIAATPGARVVHNADYQQGQLSSLKTALRELASENVAGALVCLVDHPAVAKSTAENLCARLLSTNAPVVIPSHGARRGHPVAFAARLFPELLAAPVSEGARTVVNAHAAEVAYLETPDEAVLWDVDRPEDYAALLQRLQADIEAKQVADRNS